MKKSQRLFEICFPNINYDDLIPEPELPMDECQDPEKEWDYYLHKITKKMYAYNEFESGDKDKWRESYLHEEPIKFELFNSYLS